MNIKLVQIDGKLPNLALMRLSSYYKENNDDIYFTRHITPELFENPYYDKVFASSIFGFSRDRIERLKIQYPNAIIGGTGTDNWTTKIEDHIGDYFKYDYSIYPDFEHSIGFTQRGCRLKCKFCVVPTKEGKNRSTSSIYDIWRGDGHPKKIHLLDNDFFGQLEEQWKERIKEIKEGKFKVCFNQGINIRLQLAQNIYGDTKPKTLSKIRADASKYAEFLYGVRDVADADGKRLKMPSVEKRGDYLFELIDETVAKNLIEIDYRDDSFKNKRLYTAWDNIGDEKRFFDGIDILNKYGIPSKHIMAYMLIGYDKRETWKRIFYRFNKMVERGILPYPMVYNNENKKLKRFQRYVIRGFYRYIKWKDYWYNKT